MTVTISPLNETHAPALAGVLSGDEPLRAVLGITETVSPEDFLNTCAAWMKQQQGETYAILADLSPIGIISISKASAKESTPGIGYWLASTHWNKGCGSAAFSLMLGHAKEVGVRTVTATISKNSPASYRIWQKARATFEDTPQAYIARIDISSRTPH